MQEIAILLSSLAGVATAAAVRKMPKNKNQLLTLGASAHIKNQINSLKIEKDILTKTISRLYQAESEFSKIQRDKLLLKYQHQLGIVLAKLEKLETASHHPDLGPVGDGLITLMDQKLSKLDDRLYELSSKIQTNVTPKQEKKEEKPRETFGNQDKKEGKAPFNFPKLKTSTEPIVIPPNRSKQSVELTTLTRFSRKEPKFPLFEHKQIVKPKEEIVKEVVEQKPKIEDKVEIIKSTSAERQDELKRELQRSEMVLDQKPDITKEVSKITQYKALPSPKKERKSKPSLPLEEDFEDDDEDDLDKIKGDIMRVLSKLEQAEVE